ncbi:hypothetical protein [Streptomyces lancefieldiae]|uniref:LLM class flavin-dependent oxidoreductase n=1 Tax=Streptomyces lancefieldiae TaxID=3075520 RepID=A0ABU3APT1_9ACTN|nr:hypothetical protein [Streptomyces sp. DSM 40712]MDT0612205.1 hypothetical protein [Streptomyces sp. DSM 40712]
MKHAHGSIGVLLRHDIRAADVIAFAREADAYGFGELWAVEDLGGWAPASGYRTGLGQGRGRRCVQEAGAHAACQGDLEAV